MGRMGSGASSSAARVAGGLLVLLALALPFEAPLFRLGPLQITTVELLLYATIGAWGLGVAAAVLHGRATGRTALELLRRDDMARAAALWAIVLLSSAAFAPSDRAAAFKFALRSVSGVFAFFAVRSIARGGRARGEVGRRVLLALVAGALVSAATALVEEGWAASAPAWRLFHEGTFDALGLKRASGVFGYPTIGAMYWEAASALVIVAPVVWSGRAGTRARRDLVALLAVAVLVEAILASATRSSLVGVAVLCALMGLLGWRSGSRLPRIAAAALGLLLALSAVALRPGALDSPLGQRLRWWHDDRWFGAEYDVPSSPRAVGGGEEFGVPITLRNTGTIAWRRAGALPTRLSYHLFFEPASGPAWLVEFEGMRTDLPGDVPPGGVVRVVGVARAPTAEGSYRLSWDLVQEGVTWFSERGSAVADERIEVRSATAAPPPEIAVPSPAPPPPSRAALWRTALALWRERPVLGVGPDNFRRRYEAMLSPSPTGAAYTDTRIHANSLYFETVADLGVAGLVALSAIAVALLRALRAHWRSGCVAGLGCAVAAMAFFVHGALDYFFEFTPLYGLFWVTLGLSAAFETEPRASSMSSMPPDSTR